MNDLRMALVSRFAVTYLSLLVGSCGFIESRESGPTIEKKLAEQGSGPFDNALFKAREYRWTFSTNSDWETTNSDWENFEASRLTAEQALNHAQTTLTKLYEKLGEFEKQLTFADQTLTTKQFCALVDLVAPDLSSEKKIDLCTVMPVVYQYLTGEKGVRLSQIKQFVKPISVSQTLVALWAGSVQSSIQYDAETALAEQLSLSSVALVEWIFKSYPNFLKLDSNLLPEVLRVLALSPTLANQGFEIELTETALTNLSSLWPKLGDSERQRRIAEFLKASASIVSEGASMLLPKIKEDREIFDLGSDERDQLTALTERGLNAVWTLFESRGSLPIDSWLGVAKVWDVEEAAKVMQSFLLGNVYRRFDSSAWAQFRSHVLLGLRDVFDSSEHFLTSVCLKTSGTDFWKSFKNLSGPETQRLKKIASSRNFTLNSNGCRIYEGGVGIGIGPALPDHFSSNWITEYLVIRRIALWIVHTHDVDRNNLLRRESINDEFGSFLVTVGNSVESILSSLQSEEDQLEPVKDENEQAENRRKELNARDQFRKTLEAGVPVLIDSLMVSSESNSELSAVELSELLSRLYYSIEAQSYASYTRKDAIERQWRTDTFFKEFYLESRLAGLIASLNLVQADALMPGLTLEVLTTESTTDTLLALQIADLFGLEASLSGKKLQEQFEMILAGLRPDLSSRDRFVAARLVLLGDYRVLKKSASTATKADFWIKASTSSLPEPYPRDRLFSNIIGLLKTLRDNPK